MKILHLMLASFYIDNYSYQENYRIENGELIEDPLPAFKEEQKMKEESTKNAKEILNSMKMGSI